jgi:hypothetical protein
MEEPLPSPYVRRSWASSPSRLDVSLEGPERVAIVSIGAGASEFPGFNSNDPALGVLSNMDRTVAIISRHAVSNYGSLLQAYALQCAIERLGFEPFHVDYIHRSEGAWEGCRAQLRGSGRWNRNALTRAFYVLVRLPERLLEARKFARWRSSILRLSSECYRDDGALADRYPSAGVYCTGSDQVWNATARGTLDWNYFLSFLRPDVRRIAYASSFGRETLTQAEAVAAETHLSRYNAVSVRELSGVRILEAMGVPAVRVLDPTFLLTADEWSVLIPDRAPKRAYLLVYRLNASAAFDEYARRIAKARGLDLVRVTMKAHDAAGGGKPRILPEVGDFLWYFKNAEIVITDSFHGTVFSIIFNTPFLEFLPGRFQIRNLDILQLTGLTDRIVDDPDDVSRADNQIDFAAVNEILTRERERSMQFLEAAIQGQWLSPGAATNSER